MVKRTNNYWWLACAPLDASLVWVVSPTVAVLQGNSPVLASDRLRPVGTCRKGTTLPLHPSTIGESRMVNGDARRVVQEKWHDRAHPGD